MENSDYKYRFDYSDISSWSSYLQENGYVVIGNVISQEDCNSTLKNMRETISSMPNSKLSLDDEASWADSSNYPFKGINMIQWIGHSKFQWEMRERLAKLFATVWECKETDLATSFDGFCYMDGRRKYNLKPLLNNTHTDQSPMTKGLWSYQGLVNLLDNGEDDGGFVVVPGTHKIHEEFCKKLGWDEIPVNYLEFGEEQKEDPIFKTGFKVCAKAGDVILWDSRTFHGNTLPKSENVRAAVYVCEIPKDKVSKETRELRKKAFDNSKCSTHYPGDGFETFDDFKESKEEILESVKKISLKLEDLSDLQKSLLCIS